MYFHLPSLLFVDRPNGGVDNVVHNMQVAGMAIMESFDNTFTNAKYGIRISLDGGNNNVYDNVFDQRSKCERSSTVRGDALCPRERNHVTCKINLPRITDTSDKNVVRELPVAPNSITMYLQLIIGLSSVSPCTRIILRLVLLADGLYTYQDSDAPDASSDERPSDKSFYRNTISNTGTGVKIAEADDIVIAVETKLERMPCLFLSYEGV